MDKQAVVYPFNGIFFFSVVTVTNYHQLSGLRQHKFILLQIWRSEASIQFSWAKKSKCQQGWHLWQALEEKPFPCLSNLWWLVF